jgi:hypothetical protein
LLIVWPTMLSIVARLLTVSFTHERFDDSGVGIQFRAQCTFEEIREERMTYEAVVFDRERRFNSL